MTLPQEAGPEFDPVDDIGFINVNDIEFGERLRPVDPIWAEALGRAMLREGQATPIVVCRLPGRATWTLVAGAHRVEGAKCVGIESLKAEIISSRMDERAQREVSENLWRRGLDPLDRAAFIAKLVEIAKIKAGIDPSAPSQQVGANVRWAKNKSSKQEAEMQASCLSLAYGWTDEVADELGVSKRTIYRAIQFYSAIPPSQVARLREARCPILQSSNELMKLSKLDPETMSKVVGQLSEGKAQRVAQACQLVRPKSAPDAETKRLSAFLGAFSRMSLAEKKGALEHLSSQLPAGFRLVSNGSAETQMRVRLLDSIGAVDTAFKVLVALVDGEPVDDEQLQDACGELQHTLMGLNDLKGKQA